MTRRRSVAVAPISNRDALALLKSWGFTEVGGSGGHTILTLNGRNVQITAVGRSTPMPYKALRKAASIVGVPYKDLMRGPKKEKVMSEAPFKPFPRRAAPTDIPPYPAPTPPQSSETKIAEPLGSVSGGSAIAVMDPPTRSASEVAPRERTSYDCPECDKTFATLRAVQVHRRSHKMVECDLCHKTMSEPALGPHRRYCAVRTAEANGEPVTVTKPKPKAKSGRGRAVNRKPVQKAPVETTDTPTVTVDETTLDTLIGLLFPQGIPGTLAAFRALNEWVAATERLLSAAKS